MDYYSRFTRVDDDEEIDIDKYRPLDEEFGQDSNKRIKQGFYFCPKTSFFKNLLAENQSNNRIDYIDLHTEFAPKLRREVQEVVSKAAALN